jgi:hypothetical protein
MSNVPSEILNPRNTWDDKDDEKAIELGKFKAILKLKSLLMLKLWQAHLTHKLIIFNFKRAISLNSSFYFKAMVTKKQIAYNNFKFLALHFTIVLPVWLPTKIKSSIKSISYVKTIFHSLLWSRQRHFRKLLRRRAN